VQASDPAAWRSLTDIYAPLVYSWARQTGLQEADAADVMQETFRALVARIGSFHKVQPGDSFRGWLWTITRNKIRDHFRAVASRPQATGGTDQRQLLESLPEAPPDEASRGNVPVSQAYVTQRLLQIVEAEFEPRTWRAFWEVVVGGRQPADVAVELGMSIGAVYMAKSRVLKRLRQDLGESS
jgi:RNA polymerase sigma-70 factor (ECF subfamily)